MKVFPRLLALAGLTFALAVWAESPPDRPWNQDIIYFALTDRFLDGDPENNVPAGSDPALYDKTQTTIDKYQGGDFRGLELALQSGYFKDLGVTAIWITPPVRNVWFSKYDSPGEKTGYHGYWAQDFLDIDPHLVSRKSLDGQRDYPDSRDGRMQHYKDFVALAHSQGIKVVQDIVINHAGPVFYYDANGNGSFDAGRREEWIAPFKRDGVYNNPQWAENPRWNQHRAAPGGPVTIFGREVQTTGILGKLEAYGRKGMSPDTLGKSNGEELECDFFGLRDLWTAPDGKHFEELVNDFVEVYAFYVRDIGIDGFRIDTVKHVHRPFWDAWTERLRQKLGPEDARRLILFGEIYNGTPAVAGVYTYRADFPKRPEPCLDSTLDFPFCFAARDYLRTSLEPFGKGASMEKAFSEMAGSKDGRPFYNETPGLDGLTAAQKQVTFVENHDGLNRFRVQGISARRNLLANALLLTGPGVPCLYYGTEADLQDTRAKIGAESETGRLNFIPSGQTKRFAAVQRGASFQTIAALTALRRKLPALTSNTTSTLWVDDAAADTDDGVFAFARGDHADALAVIVINASDRERVTGVPGKFMKLVSRNGKPLLARGDKLERVPLAGFEAAGADTPVVVHWNGGTPEIELHVAPESVSILRKIP